MLKYWNKFWEWSNENNTQITWFLLGFFLYDLFVKIGRSEWYSVAWSLVIITLLYITRKVKV